MSRARSRERAVCHQVTSCARVPLGWWFLLSAEPDIHLLPQATMGRRRRLSECSLPVPKQLEESLGSTYLLRSVGNRRDLAVCASMILFCFSGQFFMLPGSPAAPQERTRGSPDPQPAARPLSCGP